MRSHRTRPVLLPLGSLASCLLSHAPLSAAEQPVDLDPIVVTATRLETPLAELPASVSLVEGND